MPLLIASTVPYSHIHILIYLYIYRFTVPTILRPRTKILESLRFHLLVDPLVTSLHVHIFQSDVFATLSFHLQFSNTHNPILPSYILPSHVLTSSHPPISHPLILPSSILPSLNPYLFNIYPVKVHILGLGDGFSHTIQALKLELWDEKEGLR